MAIHTTQTPLKTIEQAAKDLVRTYWDDYLESLFWSNSDSLPNNEEDIIELDDYIADPVRIIEKHTEQENIEEFEPVSLSVLSCAYKSMKKFFISVLTEDREYLGILENPLEFGLSKWIGHDIALTQNRHGAGFWDGGYSEPDHNGNDIGEFLTRHAEKVGEIELYIGDDLRVYGYYEG